VARDKLFAANRSLGSGTALSSPVRRHVKQDKSDRAGHYISDPSELDQDQLLFALGFHELRIHFVCDDHCV
jgi:hypothetical protein